MWAQLLNVPRTRVDAVKATTAARLTRALGELAREAAAGSERLAEGLADARREVAEGRAKAGDWRGEGRVLGVRRRGRQHARAGVGRAGSGLSGRVGTSAVRLPRAAGPP